jgi:hypothetical protein
MSAVTAAGSRSRLVPRRKSPDEMEPSSASGMSAKLMFTKPRSWRRENACEAPGCPVLLDEVEDVEAAPKWRQLEPTKKFTRGTRAVRRLQDRVGQEPADRNQHGECGLRPRAPVRILSRERQESRRTRLSFKTSASAVGVAKRDPKVIVAESG